eukprot:scaffold6494_cov129-Isochrysis_galbana.AAC.2
MASWTLPLAWWESGLEPLYPRVGDAECRPTCCESGRVAAITGHGLEPTACIGLGVGVGEWLVATATHTRVSDDELVVCAMIFSHFINHAWGASCFMLRCLSPKT